MSRIALSDRILIVQLYYSNNQSVTETIRKYSSTRNLKRKEEAPSWHTVQKIVERFCSTGSVADLPRSGRPRRSEEDISEVSDVTTAASGKISTRRISLETNIPETTVRKILKVDLHLHPYRVHRVHQLNSRDYDSRMKFCREMLTKLDEDDTMLSKILM